MNRDHEFFVLADGVRDARVIGPPMLTTHFARSLKALPEPESLARGLTRPRLAAQGTGSGVRHMSYECLTQQLVKLCWLWYLRFGNRWVLVRVLISWKNRDEVWHR